MRLEEENLDDLGVNSQTSGQVAKRLQVPKACTNCRKMHAGCETTRPCKRCKQNGLESTCADIPRKKRYAFQILDIKYQMKSFAQKTKRGTS